MHVWIHCQYEWSLHWSVWEVRRLEGQVDVEVPELPGDEELRRGGGRPVRCRLHREGGQGDALALARRILHNPEL